MSSGDSNGLPELPPAPPSHVVGQGYSANRKIPTVQGYREDQAKRDQEAQEYAKMIEERQRAAAERMEKVAAAQNDKTADGSNGTPQSGDAELASDQQSGNVLKNRKGKKDEMASGGAHDEKTRMMEQMNANKGKYKSHLEGNARRARTDIYFRETHRPIQEGRTWS